MEEPLVPALAFISLEKSFDKLHRDTESRNRILKELMPDYLMRSRWFGGKGQGIQTVSFEEFEPLPVQPLVYFSILEVTYNHGKPERYAMFLAHMDEDELGDFKKARIGHVRFDNQEGILCDALYLPSFRTQILKYLFEGKILNLNEGKLLFEKGSYLDTLYSTSNLDSKVLEADQSNSAVLYEDKLFVKFFRKLFPETNPDLETIRFLSEKARFQPIPTFAGSISFKPAHRPMVTLAMFQKTVDARIDLWTLFKQHLDNFAVKFQEDSFEFSDDWDHSPFEIMLKKEISEEVENTMGPSTISLIQTLARRTAEMHACLACDEKDPHYAPESFDIQYRKVLQEKLESLLLKRVHLLDHNFFKLNTESRNLAEFFLRKVDDISKSFQKLTQKKYLGSRIRIHGDYHLGQVLWQNDDVVILDFEGEPESSIEERKIKHSPLKDVAGMLRSFHYAAYAHLFFANRDKIEDTKLELASENWYRQAAGIFLQAYTLQAEALHFSLGTHKDIISLTELHLLEKAVYEFGYELNGRPDWVIIPLKGIQQVLETI